MSVYERIAEMNGYVSSEHAGQLDAVMSDADNCIEIMPESL